MASESELAAVAPTEIRLRKDKTALAVTFDSGEAYEFHRRIPPRSQPER